MSLYQCKWKIVFYEFDKTFWRLMHSFVLDHLIINKKTGFFSQQIALSGKCLLFVCNEYINVPSILPDSNDVMKYWNAQLLNSSYRFVSYYYMSNFGDNKNYVHLLFNDDNNTKKNLICQLISNCNMKYNHHYD